MSKVTFIGLFFFLISTVCCFAQIESQWRGPNRNGIYDETNLLKEWPMDGPALLWQMPEIGDGYSSAAVTDSFVYVTGKIEDFDFLTAIDKKGNKKWQISYGNAWHSTFPDSRCTPTIVEGKIYVLSGMGEIACIDAISGGILWKNEAFKNMEGKTGEWGVCESLLVFDDKVIYTPAGNKTTMIALNKETGEIIWSSESINDATGYVSPVLFEYAGKKIITTVLARRFIGVDAANGKILWNYDYYSLENQKSIEVWPDAPLINTNSPVYHNGQIFITNGYDHVGAMFKLSADGSSVELIWTTHTLDVHHGGVVHLNGYLFGSNWTSNGTGNWCCIDWKTGKTIYEEEWICKGSIISADSLLFLYEERTGNLALAKPGTEKLDILSSFKVPFGTGPHWAHPVLKNGVLYVRHGKVLMAYQVRG